MLKAIVEESVQQHCLVIGLGKTGASCAQYLVRQGIQVTIADTRNDPPGMELLSLAEHEFDIQLGNFSPALLDGIDEVILSPGLSMEIPIIVEAQSRGIPVVGDIEIFARNVNAPVIAITGSNGKSTVTSLVGEMARESGMQVAVGGNIGTPALDLLDDTNELYVLELSSFQLETTNSLKTVSSVVLNVSPDHMDRYETFRHYVEVKQKLYRDSLYPVINLDDPEAYQGAVIGQDTYSFTLRQPQSDYQFGIIEDHETYLAQGGRKLMPTREIPVMGRHNWANCLAALALGTAAGFSMESMLSAIRSFRGLAHRTEFVRELHGVRWINDSKGTNVGATVAAIQGIEQPVILIAGGEGKGADFSQLSHALEGKVKAVLLFGKDAREIGDAIRSSAAVHYVDNLHDAVLKASELAESGNVVLFSPACASFDMFKNYEHRGDCFRQEVEGLQ